MSRARSGRVTKPGRIGRALGFLLIAAAASPDAAAAQGVLERTPNFSSSWTGSGGSAYMNIIHRFSATDAPERKVTASPTFLLAYAPADRLLLGANYATRSPVAERFPNEWELFGRAGLLRSRAGAPLDAAVQLAYNLAAESVDGALDLATRILGLRVLGSVRGFSDAGGRGEPALALAGGAALPIGPIEIAGDAGRLFGDDAFEDVIWSAGVQFRIPYTPHSLSLHASNSATATLQGSSHPTAQRRYGFEFTTPITLARFRGAPSAPERAPVAAEDPGQADDPGGARQAGEAAGPGEARDGGAVAAAEPADTVVVSMRELQFRPGRIEVAPGTLVRWVNEDPVVHTVSFTGSELDSGFLGEGEAWEHVFAETGEHAYFCRPHPFMTGVVVVAEK